MLTSPKFLDSLNIEISTCFVKDRHNTVRPLNAQTIMTMAKAQELRGALPPVISFFWLNNITSAQTTRKVFKRNIWKLKQQPLYLIVHLLNHKFDNYILHNDFSMLFLPHLQDRKFKNRPKSNTLEICTVLLTLVQFDRKFLAPTLFFRYKNTLY